MPKFGRKVPRLRCDSHTSFKVNRSKVRVRGGRGHTVSAEPGGHTAYYYYYYYYPSVFRRILNYSAHAIADIVIFHILQPVPEVALPNRRSGLRRPMPSMHDVVVTVQRPCVVGPVWHTPTMRDDDTSNNLSVKQTFSQHLMILSF